MHKVIRAVSRRKASLAASAALVGGLGAVLLTPGMALVGGRLERRAQRQGAKR